MRQAILHGDMEPGPPPRPDPANLSADTPMAALPPLSAIPDLLFVEPEENGLYRLEVVKIGGHTWLRPVYVGRARGEEE